MPLDSSGIWQYEESEAAAPVSTMLNRLAGSVSDAVGPLVPFENNTQSLSLMTNADCHVWVRGGLAGISFAARIGTATHGSVVGIMGSVYRPLWTETIDLVPNSSSPNHAFIQINPSSGQITFYMYGTGGEATTVRGSGVWPTAV